MERFLTILHVVTNKPRVEMPVKHGALFLKKLHIKYTYDKYWWIYSVNSPGKRLTFWHFYRKVHTHVYCNKVAITKSDYACTKINQIMGNGK